MKQKGQIDKITVEYMLTRISSKKYRMNSMNIFTSIRKCVLAVLITVAVSTTVKAASETLSTGSLIINMGKTPQTIGNAIKPYGALYDVLQNYNIPVKWVIGQGKAKDGNDFVYNGRAYKGGTFIIPAEYLSITGVPARITFWQSQGVDFDTVTTPLTVDVTSTIKQAPRWTLDAANGSIAQGYLTNAGITNTGFSLGAFNFKPVSGLDCCDDFFVMPHADPTWATHNRLFSWNKDCLGGIWAACHAVSALENAINPANPTQQMNFLSTRTAATTPVPWPNNSLKLWGTHSGGSVPYTHRLFDDPVAQYIGTTDLAQLNGSEQIYINKQTADAGGATRWRATTNIIAYDPTQVNVPAPNIDSGNAAAVIVYGRAFGDTLRNFVMYEAGHSHNKGTVADVAAQRAFFNFSFIQTLPKAPKLIAGGISDGQVVPGGSTINPTVSASSPLVGITFTYQWTSTCGGSFTNGNTANPSFTAPVVAVNTPCVLTAVVSDQCGRKSFISIPIIIKSSANPPIALPDSVTIDPGCGGGVSVTINVLTNDSDSDGDPITLTQVNGNASSPFTIPGQGTVSFLSDGTITFTAVEGFTGVVNLTYQVCDSSSLCTNGNFKITVGDAQKTPLAVSDATTINEDIPLVDFNVLSNDQTASNTKPGGYTGGTLSLYSASVPGAQGRVSANPDGTITFIPAVDFAGTATITYVAVNTAGYNVTGTLTVTVTNNACDGGTFQVGSATATIVSGNDWSKIYTRPVNTGGTNLTNTTAYTINSGSNRLLVVAISAGGANGLVTAPTVTWGGQTLTAYSGNALTSNRAYSFIYYLNEAGIAAAANNNLIVTFGGETWFGYVVHAAVYSNVLQAAPGPLRVGATSANNGAAASPLTATVTVPSITADDQGIFVTAYSVNGGTNSATYSSVSTNWTGNASLFGGATNTSAPIGPYYGGVGVRNVTTAATNEVASMTVTLSAGNMRPNITVASIVPSGATCSAIANRAPLANPDYGYTTNSVTPLVISDVKNNDSDDGSLTVTGATLISGSGTVGAITANGFTFTPTSGVTGTAVVEYTVSDGTLTDVARVTITITNAPVSATNDSSSANSDVVQDINVMSNDTDPENQKGVLSIVASPANGIAVVFDNGTPANYADDIIRYTPNAGYTGTDSFTYQICEDLPASLCPVTPFCASAVVYLNMLNQPPVANKDVKATNECQPIIVNALANDSDPENGTLSITIFSPPSNGIATVSGGQIIYTPNVGFTGPTDTFIYNLCDDGEPLLCDTALVVVSINVVTQNDKPIALDDIGDGIVNNVVYWDILSNDSDPDNNPFLVEIQPTTYR
jgi:hypothetical protein